MIRELWDFDDQVVRRVDTDTGEILSSRPFPPVPEPSQTAQPFTGPTTEHTPPDVAFRYLMSRSFAKPGMDIGSQTDRALAELAEYRKTLR